MTISNSITSGRKNPFKTTGTFEQFESKYNPITDCDGGVLQDFPIDSSAELLECLWTVIEGDSGKWYICPGNLFVNRTGYYIICKNARGEGYHRDYFYF